MSDNGRRLVRKKGQEKKQSKERKQTEENEGIDSFFLLLMLLSSLCYYWKRLIGQWIWIVVVVVGCWPHLDFVGFGRKGFSFSVNRWKYYAEKNVFHSMFPSRSFLLVYFCSVSASVSVSVSHIANAYKLSEMCRCALIARYALSCSELLLDWIELRAVANRF